MKRTFITILIVAIAIFVFAVYRQYGVSDFMTLDNAKTTDTIVGVDSTHTMYRLINNPAVGGMDHIYIVLLTNNTGHADSLDFDVAVRCYGITDSVSDYITLVEGITSTDLSVVVPVTSTAATYIALCDSFQIRVLGSADNDKSTGNAVNVMVGYANIEHD